MNRRAYVCLGAGLLVAGCGTVRTAATAVRQTTGSAASCAGLSPAQQFAAARVVFVGRALPGRTERVDGRQVLVSPARMSVERYLKGDGPKTVTVQTALVNATNTSVTVAEDGIEPQAGERWKIYASSPHQPFATSICLGSTLLPSSTGTRVGPVTGGGTVMRPRNPGATGNPAAALELWRNFPVDANPRPIVPLGEGLVLDPVDGFRTAEQKLAYLDGRFALATALPSGPTTAGRFAVISAAAAYARLRARGDPQRDSVPPLTITGVQLGTASFLTDRGPAQLPAWQFTFKDVADPASVLTLGPPELFIPPPPHRFGPSAPGSSIEDTATSAGSTVTISFPGALPGNGPCDANYAAGAVANRRAVAFTIETTTPAPRAGVICPALAVMRRVRLRLAQPLGARVLVSSSDGGAVEVTRAPAGPAAR